MIVQKGYKEDRLAYRAYLGDKIIWDCGKYTSGVAEAAMLGFAMAQTETPLDIQMCASASAILSALAKAIPIFNGNMIASGTMEGVAHPEPVAPVDVELHTSAVMQGFAYGYTFGLVFTSGVASSKMQGIAHAHTADVTPASGNVAAKMTGTASADPADVLNLLMASSGAGIGTASAKPHAPLSVKMAATGAMGGSCGAINLPLHTVTFMVDGEIKHQERIIHGYACPDPVAKGTIGRPTREMTVSHTFEYSHWEDDGASDSEIPLLQETELPFEYSSMLGVFCNTHTNPSFVLEEGKEYVIEWDGNRYTRTAFAFTDSYGYKCVGAGNPLAAGQASNNDLFCVVYDQNHKYLHCLSLEQTSSHTVAIYEMGSGDPLSRITNDTVFHAVFDEYIRYYTARFIVDGEVLESQRIAYGSAATPPEVTREGYTTQWVPDDFIITGDTDFEALFIENVVYSGENIAFVQDTNTLGYYANVTPNEPVQEGATYTVIWDGKSYTCKCKRVTYKTNVSWMASVTVLGLGNFKIYKRFMSGVTLTTTEPDTGEPFLIKSGSNGNISLSTESTAATHTVKII